MATLTTTPPPPSARVIFGGGDDGIPQSDSSFAARLRRARLGMVVALTAIVMIFVSYSSAYVVRKGLPSLDPRTDKLVHDWLPLPLPNFLWMNTLVLLVSTLTMELARRQSLREAAMASESPYWDSTGRDNRIPWLAFTTILGLSFLAGQLLVWRELAARGFYVATTASSSFFYLLTGMHGVHLLGGVVALLVAGAAALLRRPAESRGIFVDAAAWYWHFLTVLWIYLLCLLEFAH